MTNSRRSDKTARRLLAAALGAACGAAQASVVAYDEAVRGDLAALSEAAVLLTLGPGSTTVTGTLTASRQASGEWSLDTDRFLFAVGDGLSLNAIAVRYLFDSADSAVRGATVWHTLRAGGSDAAGAYRHDIDSITGGGALSLFDDPDRLALSGADVQDFSIGWPQLRGFGGSELSYRYAVTFDVVGAAAATAATAAVTLQELPEPATPALVAGAALLAFTAGKRRRRSGNGRY